jgi:hypothetical protein
MEAPGNAGPETAELTHAEATRFMWQWREYRNRMMWGTWFRWGAAVLLVGIAPYVLPDVIDRLGLTVLVFPALAALMCFYIGYLIAVQYRLYKQVDREFRKLLGPYQPPDFPQDRFLDRMLTISFGRVLPGAFLIFLLLQVVSAVLLARLA